MPDDQPVVIVTQLAGTVRKRDLHKQVGSLTGDRDHLAVQRALDMLTAGV